MDEAASGLSALDEAASTDEYFQRSLRERDGFVLHG
jgi:hypothetical protein